ncbi:hypothetical protein OBBRIDRAFT_791769 [Obba rivulosa]|uniref:F-box domain-containing protein n=1 Tax=Obba rivulosa TaxID=1052685 RepID=A0A8E2B1E0_9APHY|nr:hypothetical protein OBBRIDRAFT_791769 [Obba rivulosa]
MSLMLGAVFFEHSRRVCLGESHSSLLTQVASNMVYRTGSNPHSGVQSNVSSTTQRDRLEPEMLTVPRRRPGRRHQHPITRLPDELLSHIFALGAEDDAALSLIVSHVCRYWRNLALGIPALWRCLALDSRVHLWRHYLHLAKASTLDIELVSPLGRPRGCPRARRMGLVDLSAIELSMHLVAPYIHRWRSLSVRFTGDAPYLWNTALSACCMQGKISYAPLLRELYLVHPTNDDYKEFVLFGGFAPRLRRVTVHGIRLAWLPSLFQDLTYLDYTHHGHARGRDAAAEVLCMLEVSCRVRQLRLVFPTKNGATAPPFHIPAFPSITVHLACLTSLELCVDEPDVPSALIYILQHTSFPSLHSLILRGAHSPVLFPRLRYILRAFPPLPALTYLLVEGSWMDPHFVLPLLRSLPTIRHLTLCSPIINGTFTGGLVETLRAHALNGHPLRVLELVQCDPAVVRALANALSLMRDMPYIEMV